MSLKTKVKAGNITNLSDARYCAGMGVDWLGFPANTVNPETFKEITDWVTGPEFVLEVSETSNPEYILQYGIKTVEISYEKLDFIDRLPAMEWMVKLSFSKWNEQKNNLLRYLDRISYLVLEPDSQDLNVLSEIAFHFRILIHQSDTHSFTDLKTLPVEGINVTGENELKPGFKDFEKLASILEALEIQD